MPTVERQNSPVTWQNSFWAVKDTLSIAKDDLLVVGFIKLLKRDPYEYIWSLKTR